MSYYYLAASLPPVTMEGPAPMTPAAFRESCADHLAPRDLAALETLMTDSETSAPHPFVERWRAADTLLRNAIVQERATRRELDRRPYVRATDGWDAAIERGVAEAFQRRTPLERERALDALRWEIVASLAGLDPFSSNAILGYGLHLRLAERWAVVDAATGKETLGALVTRSPAKKEETA